MTALAWPWLEIAIVAPLFGAAAVRFVRDPFRADRIALACTIAAFVASILAAIAMGSGDATAPDWSPFRVDRLNAPLLPLVALMHVFTVLMTARVKMNRTSYTGHLVGESLRLACVACVQPWPLIAFLILACVPPAVELHQRGRPTRVFTVHMAAFAILLVAGWLLVEAGSSWGATLLLVAVLIRTGNFPGHLWVADLFENATFGTALLFLTPIASVYAAFRLVLPVAPDWALQGIGIASLATAVLAAGLAVVQTDVRRFAAHFFLGQASLILIGLELHTSTSLTGALCLWASSIVTLGGFGLTLRSVEARFGSLSLTMYHGLYERCPALAVGFLLMGLGCIGFPGTLGFVASELLVDGVIEANLFVGLGFVLAATLNGIAILRVYLLLFTGAESRPGLPVAITARERIALLGMIAIILGGGLIPSLIVGDRHAAALSAIRLMPEPTSPMRSQLDSGFVERGTLLLER